MKINMQICDMCKQRVDQEADQKEVCVIIDGRTLDVCKKCGDNMRKWAIAPAHDLEKLLIEDKHSKGEGVVPKCRIHKPDLSTKAIRESMRADGKPLKAKRKYTKKSKFWNKKELSTTHRRKVRHYNHSPQYWIDHPERAGSEREIPTKDAKKNKYHKNRNAPEYGVGTINGEPV